MKNLSLSILTILLSLLALSSSAQAQGTRPVGKLAIEWNSRDSEGESATGELAWNFGVVPKAQTQTAVIRIYNPTDRVMTNLVGTILNPNFKFKNGPYPGEGGSCGYALPKQSGCRIVMTFTAHSAGAKRGLVRINYWEGEYADHSPKTSYRPLVGVGTESSAPTQNKN